MLGTDDVRRRRDAHIAEVDRFLRRATDEGLLRAAFPDGWVTELLPALLKLVVQRLPDLSRGQAADVAVDTPLHGLAA